MKEKLVKIMWEIHDNSLAVTNTEADQEFVMNDIERLSLLALKLLEQTD